MALNKLENDFEDDAAKREIELLERTIAALAITTDEHINTVIVALREIMAEHIERDKLIKEASQGVKDEKEEAE